MKEEEYLRMVVSPLVRHQDSVKIDRADDERGVLLTMTLHKEDMGLVIGKNGDTARSIRRILRQFGSMEEKSVCLKIEEPLI